jgi:hypothetical protein
MPRTQRRAYQTLINASKSLALVEHCLALSIREAVGSSPLYERSVRRILLSWPQAGEFRVPTSILAEVDLRDPASASLRLKYELDGLPVDQRVELTSSEPPFRWWFLCPERNIRVAKLYMPAGARRFASRRAHGLIYRCQLQAKRNTGLSPSVVRLLRRRRPRN